MTEGETATFSVAAEGTNLQYQWRKGAENIAGETSSSYTTPAATLEDNGTEYRCVVSNTAGTVTSEAANLSVAEEIVAPSITTQPTDQSVTEGETATFSVAAEGTNLQYQWRKGTENIAGETSSSYTTPAATLEDNGTEYRCVVSNTAGTVTSEAANLSVVEEVVAPSITTHPADQPVTANETATFSVIAEGTNLAVPVAERLRGHCRCRFVELHHTDHSVGGRWNHVSMPCFQQHRQCDHQCREAFGSRHSTVDYDTSRKPVGDRGSNRHFPMETICGCRLR